ncbi:MFS transporter [Anabaena cylindrica FACHB-243]|uniref:Major facilitator superfamily MFS_1 n=1 Tax=Anabaena cylindrica (strain ATCC 27899 / PCC 7122) TaxID=272123 RepID=K9ZDI4_ANACC|nr:MULTISPECIES: MFS transporter [Anabaena]AFZ57221.1 major facilitator superfamily MFS_1 [Anabaena cylindrica PCC 7122]AZL96689.1 major facilitator superfamily MFS_1 [Anabaena sp. CCAP 1446/1C]MBD2420892.1 MFS transporter [Anabaena cylindrica FACHB-243]MBY5284693.1 MFS transporter [Anabaena sp. CCAP 1446/1C]MBY5308662.1 MFS transporter [Anabaena sp. CCAP 1446/1C]
MNTSKSPPSVLWVQVWALAGLQGAITLAWLVYNAYLPKLLIQFGFPASFAVGILVVENALAVVMEPLMGGLSDQAKFKIGSRFPFIAVGVILASALFIAIPCIVTFVPPIEVIRGILPLVLIAWALAMTVFRSPAISLLGRYAVPSELPLAVSFVTLAGGIVGAFRGIANNFILSLSPIFAFTIASFVLLAAAFALRFFNPPEIPVTQEKAEISIILIQKLSLILGTGFSVAWGSRLLMDALGKVLKTQFNTNDISLFMLGIGLAIALVALPAGFFATKIGNIQAMLSGIVATVVAMLGLVYMGAQIPTIFFIVSGFSLIVNGAIPFILELVPQRWAGLGIGIYFGGFSLAMSIFGFIFAPGITPVIAAINGALAFLVAGACIFLTQKE